MKYDKKVCLNLSYEGFVQGFETVLLTLHSQLEVLKSKGASKEFTNGYVTAINIVGEMVSKIRVPEEKKRFKENFDAFITIKKEEEEKNKPKIVVPDSKIKVYKK